QVPGAVMLRRQHVVGLDIGTTKVCAVVGEADEDGEVHIAGVGSTPSSGMRKGVVIDIDATTRAIEDAVERTERMAGMTISVLYVGVSGEHITSTNSRGVIAVSRGDHEISSADVDRVIEAARMAALPAADREIVHMLPRGFVVDGHDGVRNPIGMYGSRLEVDAHIVTGTSTVLANLPVGGHHLTSDVAVGLRTPVAEAEKLKIRHGAASVADVHEGELIEVFNVGDREPRILPRKVLCEIIEPRLQEICSLLRLHI